METAAAGSPDRANENGGRPSGKSGISGKGRHGRAKGRRGQKLLKKRDVHEFFLIEGSRPKMRKKYQGLLRSESPSPSRARPVGYEFKRRAVATAVQAVKLGIEKASRLAKTRFGHAEIIKSSS